MKLESDKHVVCGAEWCGVCGGVSPSQTIRGSGGVSWALAAGSVAEPRPKMHFGRIFGS